VTGPPTSANVSGRLSSLFPPEPRYVVTGEEAPHTSLASRPLGWCSLYFSLFASSASIPTFVGLSLRRAFFRPFPSPPAVATKPQLFELFFSHCGHSSNLPTFPVTYSGHRRIFPPLYQINKRCLSVRFPPSPFGTTSANMYSLFPLSFFPQRIQNFLIQRSFFLARKRSTPVNWLGFFRPRWRRNRTPPQSRPPTFFFLTSSSITEMSCFFLPPL